MSYDTLYLRLPAELKEWLKQEADKRGESMTEYIVGLVERERGKGDGDEQ